MRSIERNDVKRWLDPELVSVPPALLAAVGGHPLVAETLVRRGLSTLSDVEAFLDPEAYSPTPPQALPDMTAAVSRIQRALETGEKICVWGDFDVDGQTATTVLVSALRELGGDVIYHIPVRETESHGIRQPWLNEQLARGTSLLLTCDTGIDAHEAVADARAQGVDVIITDHHELPRDLPSATAILNPHRLPEGHPLSTLPGVGVAYKLAEALYTAAGNPHVGAKLLDLVALGIVADVAVQTGDTRYLLQRGLQALRRTQRLGLQELIKVAGVQPEHIDAETIGFALGPRLNALGRLADANVSVEFLTTEDLGRARTLASELEALNARRRMLCDQVQAAAEAQLVDEPSLLESSVIVLAGARWPAGIIGIVANRLAERYHRPVVLLSAPPGALARGSARSVEGCHITEALATQAHLLEGFGGHAMAAGMSMDSEHIEAFRRGLARAVAEQMGSRAMKPVLQIHGYVTLGELSFSLVSELARLAPFGPGNPPLVLVAEGVKVVASRKLGRTGHHLQVTVADAERVERKVVWWNWQGAPIPDGRFDLAFNLRKNVFRNEVDVQVVWEDARPAGRVKGVAPVTKPASLKVVDYRDADEPVALLSQVLKGNGAVEVWVEGPDLQSVDGRHRLALVPAETLVIWTHPPSVVTLQMALRRVKPSRVVVFGRDLDVDRPQPFLAYLAGLVKYALLTKEGCVGLAELAAMMGHREVSVRIGLAWLEAKGLLQVVSFGELALELVEVASPQLERAAQLQAELSEVLAETVAYRRFFGRARIDQVLAPSTCSSK